MCFVDKGWVRTLMDACKVLSSSGINCVPVHLLPTLCHVTVLYSIVLIGYIKHKLCVCLHECCPPLLPCCGVVYQ